MKLPALNLLHIFPVFSLAQIVRVTDNGDPHSVVIPFFSLESGATAAVPSTTAASVNAISILSQALETFSSLPSVTSPPQTSFSVPPRPVAGSTYRSGNAISILQSALHTFTFPTSGHEPVATVVVSFVGPSTTEKATLAVPEFTPPAESMTTKLPSSKEISAPASSSRTGTSVVVAGTTGGLSTKKESSSTHVVASSTKKVTSTVKTTETTVKSLTSSVVKSLTAVSTKHITTIATSETFITKKTTEVQTATTTKTVPVTSVPPAPVATNMAHQNNLPVAAGGILACLGALMFL